MPAHVELYEVKKQYPGPGRGSLVVDGFNLRMRKGEFVSLIGHSGCGKSTVLSMIAGLTATSGGDIVVRGKEVKEPGPDRAVVFQSPCLLPWMTALENVLLGVDQVLGHLSVNARREHAEHYLNVVGLEAALCKTPQELSSGMQQRVGIARALAIKPTMLLLDEPFGMLDSLTRMELQEVLLRVVEHEHTTALIVTHDVDEALFLADRVVMMTSGPAARVGEILEVPFERPRQRTRVVEDPRYYELREQLITFLEAQEAEGRAA